MGTNRNIQHRVPADGGSILGFEYKGEKYMFTGISGQRDLIPSNTSPFWTTCQYHAQCTDGFEYEVYVYYYGAFEGGCWAVIDAIRKCN